MAGLSRAFAGWALRNAKSGCFPTHASPEDESVCPTLASPSKLYLRKHPFVSRLLLLLVPLVHTRESCVLSLLSIHPIIPGSSSVCQHALILAVRLIPPILSLHVLSRQQPIRNYRRSLPTFHHCHAPAPTNTIQASTLDESLADIICLLAGRSNILLRRCCRSAAPLLPPRLAPRLQHAPWQNQPPTPNRESRAIGRRDRKPSALQTTMRMKHLHSLRSTRRRRTTALYAANHATTAKEATQEPTRVVWALPMARTMRQCRMLSRNPHHHQASTFALVQQLLRPVGMQTQEAAHNMKDTLAHPLTLVHAIYEDILATTTILVPSVSPVDMSPHFQPFQCRNLNPRANFSLLHDRRRLRLHEEMARPNLTRSRRPEAQSRCLDTTRTVTVTVAALDCLNGKRILQTIHKRHDPCRTTAQNTSLLEAAASCQVQTRLYQLSMQETGRCWSNAASRE